MLTETPEPAILMCSSRLSLRGPTDLDAPGLDVFECLDDLLSGDLHVELHRLGVGMDLDVGHLRAGLVDEWCARRTSSRSDRCDPRRDPRHG